MVRKITFWLSLAVFSAEAAAAVDVQSLSKEKVTKSGLYLTAPDVSEHMQKHGNKTLFLDVRTRAEVNFLGMATLADANVPYSEINEWYAWNDKKKELKLEVNSDFASEVEKRLAAKGLSKSDTVILMCRSGQRSAKAADLLVELGYKNVYTVVDGYEGDKAKEGAHKGQRVVNGWKNAGLPWSYELDQAKMYRLGK